MRIDDLSVADFEENRRTNASVIRSINEGLTAYNLAARPDPDAAPMTLCVSVDGEVRAGLLGRSAWRWLRIDTLWVDEMLRGRGIGRALLDRAESIARERRCLGMHLDTMGFQAPGFYDKLGFERFGEIDDYPDVTSVYFLKRFDADGAPS